MIKYRATIRQIGPLIPEFTEAGILVFFGANAPEELKEFAIIHDGESLESEVCVGDLVCLDEHCFQILAVGEVANKNLASLGHFILKLNGSHEPEMPGDICTEAKPLPEIKIGMRIQITSPDGNTESQEAG